LLSTSTCAATARSLWIDLDALVLKPLAPLFATRLGGAVQVDSIKTRLESPPGVCNQRLRLKYDEPLSNVAFNFNVRHYTLENAAWLVRSPS
jgi:hypothetical protein